MRAALCLVKPYFLGSRSNSLGDGPVDRRKPKKMRLTKCLVKPYLEPL